MKIFLALLVLSASSMFGGALTFGTWEEFLFGATGTFATGCGGGCLATTSPVADASLSAPFTFSGAATLKLVDLFIAGDRFAVFDNSVLLANTSVPTNTGVSTCNTSISCAIADPTDYSFLNIGVGAGSHSITIEVLQNAAGQSGGAAVLEVVSPTVASAPEPGSIALMAGGLALLGLKRWRKAR